MNDLRQFIFSLPEKHLRFYSPIADYVYPSLSVSARDFLYYLEENTDEIGLPSLPVDAFESAASDLPLDMCRTLERLVVASGDVVYLRGKNYYLDSLFLSYLDDAQTASSQMSNTIIEQYYQNEQALATISEDCKFSPEEKIVILSLLDHQRQYLLTITTAMYREMLSGRSIKIEDYEYLSRLCEESVSNLYSFCISDCLVTGGEHDKRLETVTKGLNFSLGDSWRECDDTLKILLYVMNSAKDINKPYDLVINPFSGGIELGFAFKIITEMLGVDAVRDIMFLNYSRYGQRHRLPEDDKQAVKLLLGFGIPAQILEKEYSKLVDSNALVVDDNTVTGGTLIGIQDALLGSAICEVVDIGAVELGRLDRRKKFNHDIIERLAFEPIGDRMSEHAKQRLIMKNLGI